jgi:hypothetical protein
MLHLRPWGKNSAVRLKFFFQIKFWDYMGGMKRGRHVLRAERGKDNATEKKKVSMHSHVVCVCDAYE